MEAMREDERGREEQGMGCVMLVMVMVMVSLFPVQSSPVQSSPIRFVCLVELVDGASESVLLIS